MKRILDYFRNFGNRLKVWFNYVIYTLEQKDIFIALVIILVAFASFGLGRLSKIQNNKESITIEDISDNGVESATKSIKGASNSSVTVDKQGVPTVSTKKNYVASKNGTKYYLAWCGGVNNIKEQNKVWFNTKEEAIAAGYGPAANCPGI